MWEFSSKFTMGILFVVALLEYTYFRFDFDLIYLIEKSSQTNENITIHLLDYLCFKFVVAYIKNN